MLNALFVAVLTSMRAGFGADADCSGAIRIDEKAGGGERGIKVSSESRDKIARHVRNGSISAAPSHGTRGCFTPESRLESGCAARLKRAKSRFMQHTKRVAQISNFLQ